ncbi:uncharacterized protein METZ01_LOCUS408956, partial [marine metagenome]
MRMSLIASDDLSLQTNCFAGRQGLIL